MWLQTLKLRLFGLTKVFLLFFCSPKVLQLDDTQCMVRLPLNFRTRNHFKSMYFGALAVGADCAAGLFAMHHIAKSGHKISILFKDFHAEFLKRPEAAVVFSCTAHEAMADMVHEAIASGSRVNRPLDIIATTPSISGDLVVARFVLTCSLKVI